MAVHPRYAEAIMTGEKTVEFRKRRLADDIRTVLVYATAPVSEVIGSFTVQEVVAASPRRIWDEFGESGVIQYEDFFSYYDGSDVAVAIKVADATRFATSISLDAFDPRPATPQSFAYLSVDALLTPA